MEDAVTRLENKVCIETAKKQICITDEERANCQKVAEAFREMYSIGLLILDAGRCGFVKLQYFQYSCGYEETVIFTTSRDLFNELWNKWLTPQLLDFTKDTLLADVDYQDMFQCPPAEMQRELMDKRRCFLGRSGISLQDDRLTRNCIFFLCR